MRPVLIVGGGISGLATAWYLKTAGVPSVIIEPGQLGGVIQTDHVQGCVVEAGPDSFLSAKPWARELAEELGLGPSIITSNDDHRATYIWKQGQMVRLPEGLTMMVPGKLGPILRSPILSAGSKLKGALELLQRPTGPRPDQSVAELVQRHYGQEVLDYVAEPLLAGVYGGDPAKLSAKSVLPKMVEWEAKYGSLTRGLRKHRPDPRQPLFTTLRDGLGQLVEVLLDRLRPDTISARVERIEKGYRVRAGGDWLEAERVVIACRAESVLPGLFPPITYNSATVLGLIYAREDVRTPLSGFGFLVPRLERKHISACTWVDTKFHHRAGPGRAVLRCFVTGDPAEAQQELHEKLKITAPPIWRKVSHWPQSMPQYEVGHEDKVRTIEAMLADFPGLYVTGNAYYGVGIPDCVRMAKQVAEKIARANA